MPEKNKKIKIVNVHFRNQVSYKNLEIIVSNLKEIENFPPMKPAEKVKEKYPGISVIEREVTVKDMFSQILYFVQDNGRINKGIAVVNYAGYCILTDKEKTYYRKDMSPINPEEVGKLLPVKNMENFYKMMNITFR